MKRCVVLLVAVLLAMTAVSTLAEHGEPILFRGIVWGSSYAEIAESVELEKLSTFSFSESVGTALGMETTLDTPRDEGLVGIAEFSRPYPEVAGYQTVDVELHFVYLPDENGELAKDEEHTALYHAYYTIEPADRVAAYEDLTQKLTSLYGDADYSRGDITQDKDSVTAWYGAEGTMVSLEYSTSSYRIYIHYGFLGGDQLLMDAQAAVDRARANNTDGL